jgi:glycosyltransferase involved in cell wall biosynthesis
MRICHVTPHLPPVRMGSALLPSALGEWARAAGDEPFYISHPRRDGLRARHPGSVLWIRSRSDRVRDGESRRMAALREAGRIWRNARPLIREADLVHVHGNGLLAELGAFFASTSGKPVVLSLYGSEVWHYRPRRFPDLFTRAYRGATEVTFASRGLLEHAQGHGLTRPGVRVVYLPVPERLACHDRHAQLALRDQLGLDHGSLLVNAKGLHGLGGHGDLLEAMPIVLRERPDAHLIICGTGPLRTELRARAEGLRLGDRVAFAGRVDGDTVSRFCAAADLFVLPSRLEACPVTALEALSAGTPVVSADSPGGLEIHALFGNDVTLVPKRNPARLAQALVAGLAEPRRTGAPTRAVLAEHFRPDVIAGAFRRVYADALEAHHGRRA